MIIVSHRGPYGFSVDDAGALEAVRGPGGLAGTLNVLAASSDALTGSTCVSAALGEGDRRVMQSGESPDVAADLGTDVCFVAIDPEVHRLHYETVSNEVLWFLFHGIFDLPRTPTFGRAFRQAWDAYVTVNEAFTTRVVELAGAGEIVLVQDYPLALVPGMLAAQRPDLRIAYFAHTPFCGPGGIRMLPDDVAAQLCASLAARPSGFHTRRWADAYEANARVALGADATVAPTFVASLGPDPVGLAESAASDSARAAAAELDDLVGDRALVFRSDRIDLTKNIARGFEAFDELLEAHPEWRERVVFVAKLTSSRASVPEYAAYREETDRVAARVNDRWATPGWQPLVVDTRDDFDQTVAGFLRYDVLLVNPIKDGLNLVAKEGPLVNRRDGVLCLSPEAGAYEELSDAALRVHPYDVQQTAAALHRALTMPDAERRDRAARLRSDAASRTPGVWLDDLVAHAR
jgi:trehalose 6-phosphate synthase